MAVFHDVLKRGKHKPKPGRHKSFHRWLMYGEYEDFEVYEPRRKKRVKEGVYQGDLSDYLSRDPKRDGRKHSPRRIKETTEKSDYSTKW